MWPKARYWVVAVSSALMSFAQADDFKQTIDAATIAYEGPSSRATKVFIYSRGTPLEVLVNIEGWMKVRDWQGDLAWIERKSLADRVNVQVRTASATEIYAAPDLNAPIVLRAESGVLLALSTPTAPVTGSFAQVKTRDGQSGFVRVDSLFGL